jgi:hypothetical protein
LAGSSFSAEIFEVPLVVSGVASLLEKKTIPKIMPARAAITTKPGLQKELCLMIFPLI